MNLGGRPYTIYTEKMRNRIRWMRTQIPAAKRRNIGRLIRHWGLKNPNLSALAFKVLVNEAKRYRHD